MDSDICALLRRQIADISLAQSGALERWQPELDALLQAALWRWSIWADTPTPGGQLQNLRWARAGGGGGGAQKPLSGGQKVAYLLVHALVPWLLVRGGAALRSVEEAAGPDGPRPARLPGLLARWLLRRAAPLATAIYTVAAALNFAVFLRHGVFCALSDRLLGIRMVHIDPTARRQVAFEQMNRVMMWNGMRELLMTAVPLVDLARVTQRLTRKVFPEALRQPTAEGAERACGLCGASPMVLPMRSDCGHAFCYFCVASEQMEQPGGVACPRCNSHVRSIRHVR